MRTPTQSRAEEIAHALTLLLHAGTPTVRLGVAEGDKLVAEQEFPADRMLAETLASRIETFLTTHGSRMSALEKIIVHVGPGGYSVLRVGVTTANAFAYALGIPVVGVSGEVTTLAQLLDNGNNLPAAENNVVIPVYAKPPKIGPIPARP